MLLNKVKMKKLIQEVMLRKYPIENPRGRIMEVLFDPSKTKFDVNDYILRTLKSRRTQRYVISKAKNVLQYHMVGKCIRFRSRGVGTSFKIRNTLTLTVFEMNYALYSRNITNILVVSPKTIKYKKASQYYLRRRPPSKSAVEFTFTIDAMKIWAEETTGEMEVKEEGEERSLYGQQIQYRSFYTIILQSAQQKVKRHL